MSVEVNPLTTESGKAHVWGSDYTGLALCSLFSIAEVHASQQAVSRFRRAFILAIK